MTPPAWYAHARLYVTVGCPSVGVSVPSIDSSSDVWRVCCCVRPSVCLSRRSTANIDRRPTAVGCRRHGPQRHWNTGGSQVERRRRENRGAVGCEGGRVSGGAVPLAGKFMNFSSQNGAIWCILCVLFLRFMCPMDCSCIINYRSTSLCLTNDTDWQIHVTVNFVYIYCQ